MMMLELLLLVVAIVVVVRMHQRVSELGARVEALESAAEPAPVAELVRAVAKVVREEISIAAPLPAPAPRPMPRPVGAEAVPGAPRWRFGFEDVFGRHLPIWAGGVTLIVAGVLIVKYSIDAGLLSPTVRVIAGLMFGTALIGGAEAARRNEGALRDRRIAQSLAGAGVATLYASILIAVNLYHLIAPMTAFVGLAGVTLLAGAQSLRFGAPSAVLGLVGGIAAPALVGAESPNIPLLATYLAMTVGGLCALGRTQRWWWLGALAILGGFGWGLLLILGGLQATASALSVGLLTLLVAIAFPLLLIGSERSWLRLGAAAAGCAQMAALVATGGFGGLEWALFGLIAAAIVWLSRRERLFAEAPLIGLGTGLLLAFAWRRPDAAMLGPVLAAGAVIHGVPALLRLWRADGRLSDAGQLAAIGAGVALVPLLHFDGDAPRAVFAGLALLGAGIAAVPAVLGWSRPERTGDARFALLALTGIALALLAAGLKFDAWILAPATAVAASGALMLALAARDRRIEIGGQALAMLCLLFLLAFRGGDELVTAIGFGPGEGLCGFARWLVPAFAAAAFAIWSASAITRQVAGAAAVVLAYVAAAQLVPADWLALVPVAMLVGLAVAAPRPAPLGAAAALALGWALYPLAAWGVGAGWALMGVPLFVQALPEPGAALIRIGAPVAAMLFLIWRGAVPERVRASGAGVAAVLAVLMLHILWKQLFAIAHPAAFVALGMTERTLWEALLLALALAASRVGQRRLAAGFAIAALLHFVWFTALLHDPLWARQAAGPWLVPAYGLAWALLRLLPRMIALPQAERAAGWGRMALILLFAASVLRQLFHGSMLSIGDVTPAEDICRSLLAIGLGIGFLRWGIARADRDWRVASLVLMLAAVGKVFLFDAAGLDGLLRIGSFVALGFSLISIGWLYSRYLPDNSTSSGSQD